MHDVFFELAFDIHHVIGAGDLVAGHCTPTGRHADTLMDSRRPVRRRALTAKPLPINTHVSITYLCI